MGLLDIDRDEYIFCLHYVFLNKIQEKLDDFRHRYNCHSLSTEHNRTPQQLFAVGTLANFNSSHRGITGLTALQQGQDSMNAADLETYGTEGYITTEEEVSSVNIPPVNCPLSAHHLEQLHQEIPVNNQQDPLGVDTYKRVLEFVARNMNV